MNQISGQDSVGDPTSWNLSFIQEQYKHLRQKDMSIYNYTEEMQNHKMGRSSFTQHDEDEFSKKRNFQIKARVNEKKIKLENMHYEQVFKNKLGLKKILKKNKVKAIVNNFQRKAMRNLSNSSPVTYEPLNLGPQTGLSSLQGIKIPNWLLLPRCFLNIMFFLILLLLYTLELVFPLLQQNQSIENIQIFAIIFYLLETAIKLIEKKTENGKKIEKIKQISLIYLRNSFPIDLLCILVLILDSLSNWKIFLFLKVVILLKTKQTFGNLQTIENSLINKPFQEQYWTLIKVFLINFIYAHILAILLVAMSKLNQQDNWLTSRQIQNAQWYQIYAWSYYWGATIMLTVGFGDISPQNYQQAICITVIETISCILLAYNISCVGNLISNIRSQQTEKKKKLKIMKRLAEENKFSEDLEYKVCNFISESQEMKKKFQFVAQKEIIGQLPPDMKGQVLKQSNKCIFQNLTYLKSLTEKTLIALSQHIQMKITHPQQIVYKISHPHKFLILRNGSVGYCTNLEGSILNNTVTDCISVKKNQTPRVLHLNFFNPTIPQKYLIKSLKYSMISEINLEKALGIIKNTSDLDYEHFCYEMDKSKHFLDEYEVVQCDFCDSFHTKMACPKLHFTPLKQKVIYKYLQSLRTNRFSRKAFIRYRNPQKDVEKPLLNFCNEFISLQKTALGVQKKKKKVRTNKKDIKMSQKQFQQSSYSGSNQLRFLKQNLDSLGRKFEQVIGQFKVQNSNLQQSDFWQIETDKVYNFKYYFKDTNSNQLRNTPLNQNEYTNTTKND